MPFSFNQCLSYGNCCFLMSIFSPVLILSGFLFFYIPEDNKTNLTLGLAKQREVNVYVMHFFRCVFSAIKIVRFWTAWELDYILNDRDSLYSRLGHTTSYFLSIDDLPTSVIGYQEPVWKMLQDCSRVNFDFIILGMV